MITREADYAVRALIFLAGCKETITTLELSEKMDIPYPFLRRIVNQLDSAGLVSASRGKKGGLALKKSADHITLFDIVSLFDRRGITLNACLAEPDSNEEEKGRICSRSEICSAHRVLASLQDQLHRDLKAVTLKSLV